MGLFKKKYTGHPIVEGKEDAYDIAIAMPDKELRARYMGKSPLEVPREAQEELFKRFVQSCADPTCNKCYGRGHTGWSQAQHRVIPCDCLQRIARKEYENEHKNYLEGN